MARRQALPRPKRPLGAPEVAVRKSVLMVNFFRNKVIRRTLLSHCNISDPVTPHARFDPNRPRRSRIAGAARFSHFHHRVFWFWCPRPDSNQHIFWIPDFESGASTNSATGATLRGAMPIRPGDACWIIHLELASALPPSQVRAA
jgi:hypothetical protein